MANSQLSFDDSQVSTIAATSGVASAAGGLTLNMTHISGTVPEQSSSPTQQGGFGQGAGRPRRPAIVRVAGSLPTALGEASLELGPSRAARPEKATIDARSSPRIPVFSLRFVNHQACAN